MSRLSSTAAGSLTIRYMLALVAIGMTCLASQWVIQSLLSNAESHSHVVNLAGRQRMLSQRIAKVSHQIAGHDGIDLPRLSNELIEAVEEFRTADRLLGSNDPNVGLKALGIEDAILQRDSLQLNLENLTRAATQIVALANEGKNDEAITSPLVEQIDVAEHQFLAKMDGVVEAIAGHFSQDIRRLIWIEKAITACTLLLLLFEALFVFRPAVQRISQAIQGLRVALLQARAERHNAESAIAERNLVLTAAAMDMKRLSEEIDSLLIDQISVGAKLDEQRFRMLMSHVQGILGKLTNLSDGPDDLDHPLLVSRTSPRNVVKEAVHRFRGQFDDDVQVHITMDDRLPASLLVDEQLFRDSIVYLLQSVFDSSGPEVAVHVGYDDREFRLVVEIHGRSITPSLQVESSEQPSSPEPSAEELVAPPRPEIESLDLLLAKRTLERLGGEIQANECGDRVTILLPLDENKRMTLFVDQREYMIV